MEINGEGENAMRESINVFDSTINGEFFKETPILLLFNKEDVLERKLTKEDKLKELFSDYKDGQNKSKAKEFIKEKYLSKTKDRDRFHILEGTVFDESFVKNNLQTIIGITDHLKKNDRLKKHVSKGENIRASSVQLK